MFTISPAELQTIVHALSVAAAEYSHQAKTPGDHYENTAERFRFVANKLRADFDKAFPLVILR